MQLRYHLLSQFICITARRVWVTRKRGSQIEVYRCFFSAAARAVASSTISGRNGMPSNLPIDAPAVEFVNLVYRSISRMTLWTQLFISQGRDAVATCEEEDCGKDERARQLLNNATQLVTRRDSVKPGSLFFSASSISLHTTKPRGGCRFLYSFCVVNDRQ